MQKFNQIIREFNRFELKYLITLSKAEEIKKTIRRYMVLDREHHADGKYVVSSLYYDSPTLDCYWEKENGIKFRRKLRIRHYETVEDLTDDSLVFVEIKQRVDRVTQKKRAVLSYLDALRLGNDRQLVDCISEERGVVNEIYMMLWQKNLIPAIIVRYNRQAFNGSSFDIGLRVTFDTDISFQPYPLHLHDIHSNIPLLTASQVIMEIKLNERMPIWLTELISANNLQINRISKYCRSIEAGWETINRLRELPVAERSEEVLNSAFSMPVFWKSIYLENGNSVIKPNIKENEHGNI